MIKTAGSVIFSACIIGLSLFGEELLRPYSEVAPFLKFDSTPIMPPTTVIRTTFRPILPPIISTVSNDRNDRIKIDDLGDDQSWMSDYGHACEKAARERKMLFVYFFDAKDAACDRFERETLAEPRIRELLKNFVRLRVSTTQTIRSGGKNIVLLANDAFREMLDRPGVALIDYAHDSPTLNGSAVSQFPLTDHLFYDADQMAVILNLPEGTLTQRTLIFAVRAHPEQPEGTAGTPEPYLFEEARDHAQYQADVRTQGHQFWETRFQRIAERLHGTTTKEICAESWPGQRLVEAAVECVHSWRQSSGHWNAVREPHHIFGFDMKLGDNGVWYATGIVDGQ